MRLETLLTDIEDKMYEKIQENQGSNPEMDDTEAHATAAQIALSAIKYGDLSNQASKDYIFDIDRFTSFEGNTGPYILYTIVRIKSILNKYAQAGHDKNGLVVGDAHSASEKALQLVLAQFNGVVETAFAELAPHRICAYVYDLANALNHFYHETKILSEEDEALQRSYIALLDLTRGVLESAIDVLGFSAPDRM
jgi:arginyl-tRNA synthetase